MNEPLLTLTEPVRSAAEYAGRGGGRGLAAALRLDPAEVVAEVRRSGLRGRGGAGVATGEKWAAARPGGDLVCDAAEGEPATYKDRWIIRRNPYQVLEGIAIARHALAATAAYLVVKETAHREIDALRAAMRELPEPPVELVTDRYRPGAEGATGAVGGGRSVMVNNVETLANLPSILRHGAGWFRDTGTPGSPGAMVFTLCGDVCHPGMYEMPLGMSLAGLLFLAGGGPLPGRSVKMVVPGASSPVLAADRLGVPLDFDMMRAAGSELGSGGFAVYDDTACAVAVVLGYARFLAAESRGRGHAAITDGLDRIERGVGTHADLRSILAACGSTNRLISSAIEAFHPEFEAHLGRCCQSPRDLPVPRIVLEG